MYYPGNYVVLLGYVNGAHSAQEGIVVIEVKIEEGSNGIDEPRGDMRGAVKFPGGDVVDVNAAHREHQDKRGEGYDEIHRLAGGKDALHEREIRALLA